MMYETACTRLQQLDVKSKANYLDVIETIEGIVS